MVGSRLDTNADRDTNTNKKGNTNTNTNRDKAPTQNTNEDRRGAGETLVRADAAVHSSETSLDQPYLKVETRI